MIQGNTVPQGGKGNEKVEADLKVVKLIEQGMMLRWASRKWGLIFLSVTRKACVFSLGPLGHRCSSTSRNVTQRVCR